MATTVGSVPADPAREEWSAHGIVSLAHQRPAGKVSPPTMRIELMTTAKIDKQHNSSSGLLIQQVARHTGDDVIVLGSFNPLPPRHREILQGRGWPSLHRRLYLVQSASKVVPCAGCISSPLRGPALR